jgi:Immunoglobulin domain/Secretion system C-terminal sorting domain
MLRKLPGKTVFLKCINLITIITICENIFSQTVFTSQVINQYSSVISILNKNTGDRDTIEVADPDLFHPGEYTLFIVMKGADVYLPDNLPSIPNFWGKIRDIHNTGIYSIQPVEAVEGPYIILSSPLRELQSMTNGEMAQLVTVPYVQTAVIDSVLTCKPWDPVTGTGGILALMASKKILLNNRIDVTGKGFSGADPSADFFPGGCISARDSFYRDAASDSSGLRGEGIIYKGFPYTRGFWYAANGGGGGNGKYSGGGGGGNYGPGGWAGKESESCAPVRNWGGTGRHIPSGYFANDGFFVNRIFMGGGGGTSTQNSDSSRYATRGGNGGGIIILISDTLQAGLNDTVSACGGSVRDTATAGGGGGGGAGNIVLGISNWIGNIYIDARGGKGGSVNSPEKTGPGGFGGGGLIWHTNSAIPGNVTLNYSNGNPGIHIPTNSYWGAFTISSIKGAELGNLTIPLFGTLFNDLAEKNVYCAGEVTTQLPASSPQGGSGDYYYLWQQSENKVDWVTADGDYFFKDYLPLTRFDTMYFRRIVRSGLISDTSDAMMVVNLQPISNNNITEGGALCEDQQPSSLFQSGEPVTGGTGSYIWLWEAKDSNGFSAAPGINDLSYYEPPILSESAIFRRTIKSDICMSVSNEAEFTIKRKPEITLPPSGDTIDEGDTIVFKISAEGTEPIIYQWFHDGQAINGANGSEHIIENAMFSDSGYYYCTIQNDCGITKSDSAYLKVLPLLSLGELQEDETGLIIYPNPVYNTLTIANKLPETFEVYIYDVSGKCVFQKKNKKTINTGQLPSGLYLMKVILKGRSVPLTGRFIIVQPLL